MTQRMSELLKKLNDFSQFQAHYNKQVDKFNQ